jgi:hypothetical protein
MKKALYSFLILFTFLFAQCKKEQTPLTITLYDKPLSTIQSYIKGEWKLEYEKGGFCSICINRFDTANYIWQFNSSNRVKQTYNGNVFTDISITWINDLGMYTGRDSTFSMNFYEKRGYPCNYIVDGIFKDSLVLHDNDNSADAVFYFFTK